MNVVKEVVRLNSPDEVIFKIRPKKESKRIVEMSLREAKTELVGFVFDKVITGSENPLFIHTVSCFRWNSQDQNS